MWDENQKVYTFGNSSPQAHGKKQQPVRGFLLSL